ncbi:MAG: portal protein [Tepidisphaeraceae bacterium]
MAKKPARYTPRRRRSEDDDDDTPPVHLSHWWGCDDDTDCASSLWWWISKQESYRSVHALKDLIHEAIYYDKPLPGPGVGPQHDFRTMRSSPAHLNIVMSMVDTATARLTKRRPMPVISADDAGWSEKLFAKKTSRILRRKMGGSHVEKIRPHIIRDFCIRGDGVAKVVRVGGDVGVDRIPIYELVWDELEAQYGPPRTLAHVRPIAREVLLAEYPEHRQAIIDAPRFTGMQPWAAYIYSYAISSDADLVEVAEGWHLPPNGQHVIAIKNAALLREKWKRPRFPVFRAHWSAPTRGFRGTGLVEQLAGIQSKVNDVVRDMQENLYFGSALKVFIQRNSNVNKHHLRARHPVVIEHDGPEPRFVAPNPVSQSAIQFLQYLIQQAYEITGISQMSASAKNTLGSNASGRAIDTMEDIQSERFAHVESGWMQFAVELGQGLVDEAQAMYLEATHGDGEERESPLAKKDLAPWIREHDWSKVDIDSGNYHLTMEPINFLPDSRAGKLSYVSELSKAGLIPDPTMTADLFDEPDIARSNRTILGPKHRIDQIMEGCADPDVDLLSLMPDEYDNLPLLVLMAKGELKEAQANPNCPPEVLDRYTSVIDSAKELMTNARKGAAMTSPSLPGMMADNMGAAPNAATLLPAQPVPGIPPGAGAGIPAGGLAA